MFGKKPAKPAAGSSGQPANDIDVDIQSASVPDTLNRLNVDPVAGLSQEEVESRRQQYGWNEVAEQKEHPLRDFLKKFWGVSAWMLELILILSAFLKKWSDLAVVGALLLINAVIGFLQERRAAGVVETLRRRLQVSARVLRAAAWQVIPSRDLVPGDIVRIRMGDIVPADVRLLSDEVSVDQSALTGESAEIDKTPGDVLPSGSVVRRGEGTAVVLLTGSKTTFGRTTELVQAARPKLHIESVVSKVVRWLFLIVSSLLALVAVLSLIRGAPLLELIPLLLVLLMSAVPVALPVMFTVSMAVGSKELARRGVLVTRLSAAEDAATMDVLCVDKTGTITLNQLTVAAVEPQANVTEADVLRAGALASREENQDPIDLAFLAAAQSQHALDGMSVYKTISFLPFDAKTRRTEAVIDQDGKRFRVIKGAVRTVAEVCELQPPEISGLEERVQALAQKGYRALAVARGPEGDSVSLLGLVALYDPPRPDAKSLIEALRDLGISVKMLTGDALAVAGEIGRTVGLSRIRRAADLKTEADRTIGQRDGDKGSPSGREARGQPDGQTDDPLLAADGLAEIYPEDKFLVVQRLQQARHVTGMTGDGVNDAPALRQAEVGIAVSTATDVARGAASVVLTDPGLTNIVSLVNQGRIIYQRILTWIINKVSRTVLKASFVAISYVMTGRFVVSAFVMLLLVFMTDFAKISLATDKVRPSRKPETWNIGAFIWIAVILGVAMVIETLLLLAFCWQRFGLLADDQALYSFSFLTLLYFAVFSILSARERHAFWHTRPGSALVAALAADVLIGTTMTAIGLADLAPLPSWQVAAIFGYALVACLGVNDALKAILIRRYIPSAVA